MCWLKLMADIANTHIITDIYFLCFDFVHLKLEFFRGCCREVDLEVVTVATLNGI